MPSSPGPQLQNHEEGSSLIAVHEADPQDGAAQGHLLPGCVWALAAAFE